MNFHGLQPGNKGRGLQDARAYGGLPSALGIQALALLVLRADGRPGPRAHLPGPGPGGTASAPQRRTCCPSAADAPFAKLSLTRRPVLQVGRLPPPPKLTTLAGLGRRRLPCDPVPTPSRHPQTPCFPPRRPPSEGPGGPGLWGLCRSRWAGVLSALSSAGGGSRMVDAAPFLRRTRCRSGTSSRG